MQLLEARSKDLRRWDVKYAAQEGWADDGSERIPMGKLLMRVQAPAPNDARLGSIHFTGTISLRSVDQSIKGKTYLASPGNVVFSKIDARNGAIAVVSQDSGPLAFSAEYPIYEIRDEGTLRGTYAALLCRTSVFRSKIQALTVGHSGRKRLSPKDFESLSAPIPDLDTQDSIVADYHRQLSQIAALEQTAATKIEDTLAQILDELGVDYTPPAEDVRQLVVQKSNLGSWSFRRAAARAAGSDLLPVAKFPVTRIEDGLAEILRGVSKSPGNRPARNARPYIRVANIRAGWLDLQEVKMIDVTDRQFRSVALRPGDLLVCRNNSLELVGKTAMWRGEIADCTHDDHSFRLRADRLRIDPGFMEAYLNTPYAQQWMRTRAQITTNLAGVPGTALAQLPVPEPPLPLQQSLSREYRSAIDLVLSTRAEAAQLRETAWTETQARIAAG